MAYNHNIANDLHHLGVGLYSLAEGSRLLKTPRRTLSRWVEGYVLELRAGPRSYAPVVVRQNERALTFGDLVELMYVRGFREAGVSLDDIRQVAVKFRKDWGTPYPLATKRFSTDGRRLLVGHGTSWQEALTGQHQAFFEELGGQLVHTGDLTTEWRPLGIGRAVLLSPKRAFGKPIDDASGTHTYVLAQALAAEGDAAAVAWWYGTSPSAIEDASEFERRWRARSAHLGAEAA